MKAVITGGCSGLGLAFSKFLIARGYFVFALYNTSVDNALKLENEFENIKCIKCDITNEEEIKNVIDSIDEIDLLINNAGIAIDNDYQNKSKQEFMKVIETNLGGTFLVTKYALSKLNSKGIIINISSNNAIDNYNPISMDYDASKAGINMLTKNFSLILEDLNKNNKIIAVCPGWILTDSVKEMNPLFLEQEMKKNNQNKIIIPNELVEYIINHLEDYQNGEIVIIKEV